jgi:hypothetical protein
VIQRPPDGAPAVARHAPGLADRLVSRAVATRLRAGDFAGAPLAAGLLRRARGQDAGAGRA